MRAKILVFIIPLLLSAFENFDVNDLENRSILFHSQKLSKMYSGKKIQWQKSDCV